MWLPFIAEHHHPYFHWKWCNEIFPVEQRMWWLVVHGGSFFVFFFLISLFSLLCLGFALLCEKTNLSCHFVYSFDFFFFLLSVLLQNWFFFLISSFNIRLTRNWVLWFFFKGMISISLPGSWAWNANPSWHQNFYLDFLNQFSFLVLKSRSYMKIWGSHCLYKKKSIVRGSWSILFLSQNPPNYHTYIFMLA